MRKLVFFLVITVLSVITLAASAGEPQTLGSKIDWQTSMDGAIQQAKAQNKLILMDFFNPQ